MTVDLHLGDQIWIQQGDSTKIQLGGRLQLVLGEPLTIEGQIDVKSGKLDVSGKQFEIESGVVTFSGEPGNPRSSPPRVGTRRTRTGIEYTRTRAGPPRS